MARKPAKIWKRSSDINDDRLHLFETGEMYDCSFRVGSSADNKEVIKCHKLYLSTASNVFYTMFNKDYAEASKGPDDPIDFVDVEPEAFKASMRYIYAGKKDFKDADLAAEIYMFAHKMEITSLLAAIQRFIKNKVLNISNVLTFLDIFYYTGNEKYTKFCKEMFMPHAEIALDSPSWLDVTSDTVALVLQMELPVEEIDILEALVKWGKAQIQIEDIASDPELSLLKSTVEPFLKLIRFESMPPEYESVEDLKADVKLIAKLVTFIIKDSYPQTASVIEKRPARKSQSVRVYYSIQSDQIVAKLGQVSYEFTVSSPMSISGFQIDERFSSTLKVNCIPLCSVSTIFDEPSIQWGVFTQIYPRTYLIGGDSFGLVPGERYRLIFALAINSDVGIDIDLYVEPKEWRSNGGEISFNTQKVFIVPISKFYLH